MVVIASSSKVLSPPLWYYCVLAALHAIDRTCIDVFVSNLNATVGVGVPSIIVAVIVLRESVFHPTCLPSSASFLAILVSRVIVKTTVIVIGSPDAGNVLVVPRLGVGLRLFLRVAALALEVPRLSES